METLDPCGRASLDPRGLIGKIYVGQHQTLLHKKYIQVVGLMASEKKIL